MRPIYLILLIFLSSCASKIPFTSNLQKKYSLEEARLKKIQFYTSKDIVLIKTESRSDVDVNEGKVVMMDKKRSEAIIIKKNTPCVLVTSLSPNKFIVSFELGDDKYLVFGADSSAGAYSLMAKNWNSGVGNLRYAHNYYNTKNGDVCLMVKAKKLKNTRGRKRTVSGRTI